MPLYKRILALLIILEVLPVATSNILVVGSINADTFLPVARLPIEGENLTVLPGRQPTVDIPGGKGCTQAVAAAKLCKPGSAVVRFVGQLGGDAVASVLEQALHEAHVDTSFCGHHEHLSSGRGYVFLTSSGQVSAVVSGGSNADGWTEWEDASNEKIQSLLHSLISNDCRCVMLQREVPEYVNRLVATYAKQHDRNILVVQDVGGEDRPIDPSHLRCCDYLIPNESELKRLVLSLGGDVSDDIVGMARFLQQQGAHHVLVTQGSRGCTLVTSDGQVLHHSALPVYSVVDETGAGDCFRAAWVVALLEGMSLPDALAFASSAGACSVERPGAVPSAPSRHDVQHRLRTALAEQSVLNIPRGDGFSVPRGGDTGDATNDFAFLIGSRLNSMKDRSELWGLPLKNARDYVQRQATVKGLTCVDFNYPQHFDCWTVLEAKQALDDVGLVAGAVCLRYPSKFARGAMNHPDSAMRREAIMLTKEAAQAAIDLGCNEVVIWSAFDGYDYPFQVDYDTKWEELVAAFQECCDAYSTLKFSVEYKPTDENTRFFTVPSTGAALLLVQEVNRPNFGLTLDVGHMLMSGENPGQSIAMVGRAGKLFGIQLNDGYTRLAAEDGLMFGSIHPSMALEIMYQLRRVGFNGHMYFDTFPQRSDPILEAEYNIERVKAFWHAAGKMDRHQLSTVMAEHDAVGALRLIGRALRDAL
jgi:ribokinase